MDVDEERHSTLLERRKRERHRFHVRHDCAIRQLQIEDRPEAALTIAPSDGSAGEAGDPRDLADARVILGTLQCRHHDLDSSLTECAKLMELPALASATLLIGRLCRYPRYFDHLART